MADIAISQCTERSDCRLKDRKPLTQLASLQMTRSKLQFESTASKNSSSLYRPRKPVPNHPQGEDDRSHPTIQRLTWTPGLAILILSKPRLMGLNPELALRKK